MNTKQKLTLGIAAIFMVTLTIVGVTYAYFTTQVSGNENPTRVEASAATFGSITYVQETSADASKLSWADDEGVATILFKVSSESESAGKYDLSYTTNGTGYIKSLTAEDGTPDARCIGLPDNTTGASLLAGADTDATEDDVTVSSVCYAGSYYDYVTVDIRYYDSEAARTADTARTGGTEVYSGQLSAAGEKFAPSIDIAAGSEETPEVHYYAMTVTHVDATKNQNLEQGAEVTVIPDIAAIG